jgi:hypothetical protein
MCADVKGGAWPQWARGTPGQRCPARLLEDYHLPYGTAARREDGAGVGRLVDIHHGMQRLGRTRGRPVADERHMIPELHSNAPGCLQAGVSQETD